MKRLLLLFALTTALVGKAQKPDWGRTLEATKKSYTPVIVGDDDRAIYAVDYPGRNFFVLEQYDKKNLNRKYSREIEVPSKGRKTYDIEQISFFGDKFLVFASFYDRKEKNYELRAFTYSANKARNEGDYEVFSNTVEKRRRKGDFSVYPSKNRETVLVHFSTYYKDKDQTVEVVKLYDKDMKPLVEREYVADGRHNGSLKNVVVDDEGSVYFLRDNEVVVLDANADFEEWSEPIVVDEKEFNGSLQELYFSLNSDNDLVIVGNYITKDLHRTDEKKRGRDRRKNDTQVEGVYFMRINGLTKETEVARLNKFDKDYLDQFKSKKDVRKGRDAEMNNDYNSFDFLYKDDGGIVFVAEEQYMVQYTNQRGQVIGESYFYKDLVTYNFSNEGEMIWANRVPKNQQFYWRALSLGFNYGSYGMSWMTVPFYVRGHFSYVAGLSDDKLYVIYNDDKKNIGVKNDYEKLRDMKNVKKAVPVVYEIDLETGNKSKRMDLAFTNGVTRMKPSVNYQKSQTDPLYIFAMHKKNYRYGKLDFSETGKRSAKR